MAEFKMTGLVPMGLAVADTRIHACMKQAFYPPRPRPNSFGQSQSAAATAAVTQSISSGSTNAAEPNGKEDLFIDGRSGRSDRGRPVPPSASRPVSPPARRRSEEITGR